MPNKKTKNKQITIFEGQKIRRHWDDKKELWYFAITDIIEILSRTDRPRKYWNDLKTKLKTEGSEVSEKIGQLKMKAADGKFYLTDAADTETMFRLIQSISSPKAEPFKLWLAKGGRIAKNARKELEGKTGKKSSQRRKFSATFQKRQEIK